MKNFYTLLVFIIALAINIKTHAQPNCPSIFTVSGGGSMCADGTGLTISLSGSETGINYQLKRNGANSGAVIIGTGNTLSWPDLISAGTYTVSATNSVTGCVQNMTGSTVITVNPMPTLYQVNGPGSICPGASANISLGNSSQHGINYQLQIDGVSSGSPKVGNGGQVIWAGQTTPGVYTIVATNPTSLCTRPMTGSVTLTINSLPVQYTVGGGGTMCAGSTGLAVVLSGSETGINYQLKQNGVNLGAVVAGTGNALNWPNLTTQSNYTVAATNSVTGCLQNMTGSAVIVVHSLPIQYSVTGPGPSPICSGVNANIQLGGSETGVSYQLQIDGVNSGSPKVGAGAPLVWASQTTTGVYTVIATNPTPSCTRPMTGSATLTVNPLPVQYAVSGGGSMCADGTGLTISLSGSETGINYQLKRNGANSGAVIIGTGNTLSWPDLISAGTYTVSATNSVTGCLQNMTGSTVITVNPMPTLYQVNGPGSICPGASANILLGSTSSQHGINYQLQIDGVSSGSPKVGNGGQVIWAGQTTPGVYTIVATNPTSSCSRAMTGSVTLTISSLPIQYTVSGGGAMCEGSTGVAVVLSGSETGINYQLKRNGALFGSVIAGTGSALNWTNQTSSGSYEVVATNSVMGCSQNMTGSGTITVNVLPTLYPVIGSNSICSDVGNSDISLGGSQSGISYQLQINGVNSGSPKTGIGSGSLTWVSQTTAGVYTVVATNPSTSCTRLMTGSATLTVNPSPIQYAVNGGGIICLGGAGKTITLSNSEIGVDYQLRINGSTLTFGATLAGTGSSLSWPNQETIATYVVRATHVTGGCQQNMNGVASVGSSSLPNQYTVSGGGAICSGGGTTINLSGSQSGVNYQLKIDGIDVGTVKAGTGGSLSWTNQGTGGTYTVIATNSSGCVRVMNGSATITYNSPPTQYAAGGGGLICSGSPSGYPITLNGSETGVTYQLKLNGTNLDAPLTGTGGALNWMNKSSVGTYTLLGTRTATGCTQIMVGSPQITTGTAPTLFTISGGGVSCLGASGATVTLNGSQSGVNYQLRINDLPSGPPVNGNGNSVNWDNQFTAGTYTVTATNATGCTQLMTGNAVITEDQMCVILHTLAFQNKYDTRNRLIEKKIPGADWVYMVYDSRDRLVMTQDGEQRKTKQWSFIKYDALDRPIINGIYTHDSVVGQATMSSLISTTNFFETYNGNASTNGYTNSVFPTENTELLQSTYYDNYSFKSLIADNEFDYKKNEIAGQYQNPDVTATTAFNRVVGQQTGNKAKVLGENKYLWQANYYDDKYRIVQTVTNNNKSGIDRSTYVFDFVGKIKLTRSKHTAPGIALVGTAGINITRTFEYDHAARLLKTWHQLNNQTPVLLVRNEYNELGQLVTEKLHNEDPASAADDQRDYKQNVDYRYNIRGWLSRINNSDLTPDNTGEPKDYFGMNLIYNESNPSLANSPAFNGNISAMKWSTNLGLGFNDTETGIFEAKERAYTFTYDTLNRLKSAHHHTLTVSWNPSNAFHEKGFKYDLNGNIKALIRTEESGLPIDELSYTYAGNQLLKVTDDSDKTKGFVDGPNAGDDYQYDANGNMTLDHNKSIDAIAYNYLNLPEKVIKMNGDYIKYTYDATGRKLSQSVYNSSNVLKKKSDYAGGFFYENDTLKFINQEKGRITMTGDSPEYQYHLRDHLGNVRLTFATKEEVDEFHATIEDAHIADERAEFPNYDSVFTSPAIVYNHTVEAGATRSVVLNGTKGKQIGLAKNLKVVPGDIIDMELFAKYFVPLSSGEGVGAMIASAVTGAFGLSSESVGLEQSAFQSLNEIFNSGWFIGPEEWEDTNAPKAYLNYILFDEDFIPYDMGWDQISANATASATHDHLTLQALARKPGFIYIYFSNEDDEIIEVYFDDFDIKHIHSPVIQANEYYPFGLTFNSYEKDNTFEQKQLYNGKELQTELNLGWYDYQARQYDAAIGRFLSIDPAAETMRRYSVYAYGFDNPIRYIDPDGSTPKDATTGCDDECQRKKRQVEFDQLMEKFKKAGVVIEYAGQDGTNVAAVQGAKGKANLHKAQQERLDRWKLWTGTVAAGDKTTDMAEVAYNSISTNTQSKFLTLNRGVGRVGNVFNGLQVANEAIEGNIGGALKSGIEFGLELRGYTAPMMAWDLMMFFGKSQMPEEALRLSKVSMQNYRQGVYLESKGHHSLARNSFNLAREQERKVLQIINNLAED
jgi:RHS repeat-associated protein